MKSTQKRVWVISELYYPEETSTGYFLTCTAEGLVQHFPVSVLCSQPTYAARGQRAARYEVHNGVQIHRCWGTTFNKDRLLLRLVNMVTITLSIFFNALLRIRPGDCVLVVTNPPPLPFAVSFICTLRRAHCILIIHDVYPEVLVATDIASPRSMLTRFVGWLNRLLYRSCARIVVLGRDMRKLAQRKLLPNDRRVTIIENWSDLHLVQPQFRADNALLNELQIADKFVLQYAGNMGRTHGLEYLVASARQLVHIHPEIHFLFVGTGAKKDWLEQTVKKENLSTITLLGKQPRSQLSKLLNACDVAVITYREGMSGVSVPSRMYNIMAAGKPIIAMADLDSELARVVMEEQIGWIVLPGDETGLVGAVLEASRQPVRLLEMGLRARRAAETKYSLERANHAYKDLVDSVFQISG